jgi:hypothetical protein
MSCTGLGAGDESLIGFVMVGKLLRVSGLLCPSDVVGKNHLEDIHVSRKILWIHVIESLYK